jgi:exopolysaccharide biosynthesis polyprenyl glycosylphosphotransferase
VLRYNFRYQVLLLLVDAALVLVALAAASWLRRTIPLGEPSLGEPAFYTPPLLYLIAPLVWLFAFGQAKVYSGVAGARFSHLARRVAAGHALAALIFTGALYLTVRDYSRLQAIYYLVMLLALTVSARATLWRLRPRLATWINTRRAVLIVGTGEPARRFGALVQANHLAGMTLIGYVAFDETDRTPDALGTLNDLAALAARHRADEIIVDTRWFDADTVARVQAIMHALEHLPVNIRLAHDYSELAYFRATSEDFQGMTLISLRESVLSPAQRILKRLFDIAFASLFIAFTLPLWALIALAIRLDSPGPIFYTQLRAGEHGRRFPILKFRTMVQNADQLQPPGGLDKTQDDPRVTRIGKFLRRTSLDELPQFVNVVRGDMSVVGPRPEVAHLAEQYEWWQRKRFEVPQGITGWWQVNGRSDLPMQLNTEYDLFYVRNYSIWLDVQIIFRTVIVWITGKGAY